MPQQLLLFIFIWKKYCTYNNIRYVLQCEKLYDSVCENNSWTDRNFGNVLLHVYKRIFHVFLRFNGFSNFI